jgi:hypothetical protein
VDPHTLDSPVHTQNRADDQPKSVLRHLTRDVPPAEATRVDMPASKMMYNSPPKAPSISTSACVQHILPACHERHTQRQQQQQQGQGCVSVVSIEQHHGHAQDSRQRMLRPRLPTSNTH